MFSYADLVSLLAFPKGNVIKMARYYRVDVIRQCPVLCFIRSALEVLGRF